MMVMDDDVMTMMTIIREDYVFCKSCRMIMMMVVVVVVAMKMTMTMMCDDCYDNNDDDGVCAATTSECWNLCKHASLHTTYI